MIKLFSTFVPNFSENISLLTADLWHRLKNNFRFNQADPLVSSHDHILCQSKLKVVGFSALCSVLLCNSVIEWMPGLNSAKKVSTIRSYLSFFKLTLQMSRLKKVRLIFGPNAQNYPEVNVMRA